MLPVTVRAAPQNLMIIDSDQGLDRKYLSGLIYGMLHQINAQPSEKDC
jgi:hypothetical protein